MYLCGREGQKKQTNEKKTFFAGENRKKAPSVLRLSMNPYKCNLTDAQLKAVTSGRARLLQDFARPPYSDGQRKGEFSVDFVKEWVDSSGTLDEFILLGAENRLDDAWTIFERANGSGTLLRALGRDKYTLLVPHDTYMDFARAKRRGLPCVPDAYCTFVSLVQLLAAAFCAYAAFLWAPEG